MKIDGAKYSRMDQSLKSWSDMVCLHFNFFKDCFLQISQSYFLNFIVLLPIFLLCHFEACLYRRQTLASLLNHFI